MSRIPEEGNNYQEGLTDVGSEISALVETVQEPFLVLDKTHRVLAANDPFQSLFELNFDITGISVKDPSLNFSSPELDLLLDVLLPEQQNLENYPVNFKFKEEKELKCSVKATLVSNGMASGLIYLSFRILENQYFSNPGVVGSNFQNILAHAPAMICVLKGPDHVFEVANDLYLQLIDRQDILGKTVREVLPEAEMQGFLKILDTVYSTGQPFIGTELALDLKTGDGGMKKSYLDFLYQPTRNHNGVVDGIFVHAIDVSEKVEARQRVEESNERLRILVESMPAIVWMSNKDGETAHLNKNWYRYTKQTKLEAAGWGWLQAVDPAHKEMLKNVCESSHKTFQSFSVSFRLFNGSEFRWVINTGEPKFDAEGNFEGMIGTIIDAHEEKLKEEQLRENEHRIRSIVEEATVATALYLGEDFKIELANEAMIELWAKDSSVIGKNLIEALPELQGQPFIDLLREVYATGQTYWGKEDRVDLLIEGELQSGYFNFTYKPLRNEKGDIYGILNMALDVTEMVESKLLLKESESHFRQMADLMPEKVANTTPEGEFIYFNQNWLEYTGLSSEELQETGWAQFIHPEERKTFEENWRKSLETGDYFEMELRFLDRFGKYKWHLSRAEVVRDDKGKIKMWIGNNTEIQKLKEEEKRKGDFLKMVSHELKTPVTSIKGYVQLLLSLLKEGSSHDISKLPVRPSLERIDHQIHRLTRLISEMLDISRIEENKLMLQKTTFSINDLVNETVQDIRYTNTQHVINVYHEDQSSIYGDRDRIGQVLINLINNAIKYSPEKHEVEVRVLSLEKDKVSVIISDEGIGIDPRKHQSIFKRFFRAGGKSEETFSGFGIGLYLAKEIIQRHEGTIEVKSELGQGAEFKFTLAAIN